MSKNLAADVKVTERAAAEKNSPDGKRLKIGMIGFGTVGRSVAKILSKDPAGPLALTHICNRNIAKKKVEGSRPRSSGPKARRKCSPPMSMWSSS